MLADDQPEVRSGMRAILGREPDIEVVGEAEDGRGAVGLARRRSADLVVMDVRMPVIDGITATGLLAGPSVEDPVAVLVVTTYDLDEYVFEALRAGASGFLLKESVPDELVPAIRAIGSGRGLIGTAVTRRLITEYASLAPPARRDPRLADLTRREDEILLLLAGGLTNGEIATTISVGEATVKTHVSALLRKLGLRNRVEAVIFASNKVWSGSARTHSTPDNKVVKDCSRCIYTTIGGNRGPHSRETGKAKSVQGPTVAITV